MKPSVTPASSSFICAFATERGGQIFSTSGALVYGGSTGEEIADLCQTQFSHQTYDGGEANHQFNGTCYDLQDDFDNYEAGCTPYGPTYR